jgi:hypothetical protein
MPPTTMVCLANSRKINGRCLAGLAWDGNKYSIWIRPVSGNGSGELHAERLYEDWTDPQLLDVIDLSLLSGKPSGCHVEDIVVDTGKKWQKQTRLTFEEALNLTALSSAPLWVDGKHTSNGINDVIDQSIAETLPNSLRLICPDKLVMRATAEYESRRRVRGEFSLGHSFYRLSITDPRIESEFLRYDVGTERVIDKPLLCISIGEALVSRKACYKLIAGVMEG